MECPQCATPVSEDQRFCNKCGASLAAITAPTQAVPETADTLANQPAPPSELAPPSPSEPTSELAPPSPSEPISELAPSDPPGATSEPAVPEPTGTPEPPGPPDAGEYAGTDSTPISTARPSRGDADANGFDMQASVEDIWATTTVPAPAIPGPPTSGFVAARDSDAVATIAGVAGAPTGQPDVLAESTPFDPAAFEADDGPVLADFGDDATSEIPEPIRVVDPPRVRLVLVLAIFTAIAALLAAVADVIDLRTSRPVDGIATGFRQLDDFGGNLVIGAIIGAGVMFLGAVFGSLGMRWGAGLAGGSGLALAGWAALTIGLTEIPIAAAKATTAASDEPFTLTVTRDIGWWIIAAIGVLGVLAFLSSMTQISHGGRAGLNPWIAAIGAVVGLAVAVGPMIPVSDAVFSDNLRTSQTGDVVPELFVVGRLIQVGLIALAVIAGFLLVRRWGLGLVTGGLVVAGWMWATTLADVGERPIGIAAGNIGAADQTPHGVTSVGLILTTGVLAVAITAAAVRRRA